jgi:sulfur dioxygenase
MLDNRSMAFTGDCLLARGSTWADFREAIPVPCTNWCAGGSSACPTRVCPISLSIPGLRITSVGEERQFNPRLSGEIGEADFTGYMKKPAVGASEEDGCRGAGHPQMRPARDRP